MTKQRWSSIQHGACTSENDVTKLKFFGNVNGISGRIYLNISVTSFTDKGVVVKVEISEVEKKIELYVDKKNDLSVKGNPVLILALSTLQTKFSFSTFIT